MSVRRTVNQTFRFSGGFAGPGESVTGCLNGSFDAVAHLGVHVQRHASTAVVSTALARSTVPHGALVRVDCRCRLGLPET